MSLQLISSSPDISGEGAQPLTLSDQPEAGSGLSWAENRNLSGRDHAVHFGPVSGPAAPLCTVQ